MKCTSLEDLEFKKKIRRNGQMKAIYEEMFSEMLKEPVKIKQLHYDFAFLEAYRDLMAGDLVAYIEIDCEIANDENGEKDDAIAKIYSRYRGLEFV